MQMNSEYDVAINNNPIDILFSDNEISDNVRVVDFMDKTEKGETVITLCSSFFMKGPLRIEIRNRKLKIMVSEVVDRRRNVWNAVNNWKLYTHQSYTRIHNIRILLPEDNFSIVQQLIIPEKFYLRLILSQSVVA